MKDDINKYRVAIIYGDSPLNNNKRNGEIELYGETSKDYMHSKYLLDYVKENYPEVPIFKQLTIRHQRELIAYFLVKMGNIVFFNTTPTTEKEFQKYGKTGQFMMPDIITEEQYETLNKFCQEIKDYDVLISYNITLKDGLLDSKTLQGTGNINPEIMIENYNNQLSSENESFKK